MLDTWSPTAATVDEPGIDASKDGLYDLVGPFLSEICADDDMVHSLCQRMSEERARCAWARVLRRLFGLQRK
jgi:hypothetical protein